MNHEFWYLSRAAGFTAYGLLFLSVALGIMIGTRLTGRFSRSDVFDIHSFVSILALVFAMVHVYVLLGDAYFHFSIWQLSLPFASPYLPWQTSVGVFSLYVLAIVVATSYTRQFIGYRAWRTIHFATFALFGSATIHGIVAGTDTREIWARVVYLCAGLVTLGLIMYRLQYRLPVETQARRLRFGAGGAAVVAVAVLLLSTGMIPTSGGEDEASTALTITAEQRAAIASLQEASTRLAASRESQQYTPPFDEKDDEHEGRTGTRREHEDEDEDDD